MSAIFRRAQRFDILTAILRGETEYWRQDLQDRDLWASLLPLADLHKATTLLPSALRSSGAWTIIPEDVAEFLEALEELNRESAHALEAQGLQVLADLKAAGIVALPLKGLAYQLMGLYADAPGARICRDVDILVAPDDAVAAQTVLKAAGYAGEIPSVPLGDYIHYDRHHLPPLLPTKEVDSWRHVEVHQQPIRSDFSALLPADAVLDAAKTSTVRGHEIAMPCITHLVDHAVLNSGLHDAYAARWSVRLRDAVDMARLSSRARAQGHKISDLGFAADRRALIHFGTCLRLLDQPCPELAECDGLIQRHLAHVRWRQNVPERPHFEKALVANIRLMRRRPAAFLKKSLSSRPYSKMVRLITARPV